MPKTAKPIRYGRPNMAALPPRLGRQIIREILNTPPFDYTELKREAERAERHLAKMVAKMEKEKNAASAE